MAHYKEGLFLVICLCYICDTYGSSYFRSFFSRLPDRKLLSARNASWDNVTTDVCASLCLEYAGFPCKSFDYVNAERRCIVYPDSDAEPAERLVPSQNFYHYVIVPDQKVSVVPNRRLIVHNVDYKYRWVNSTGDVDCLTKCLQTTTFRCRSYDLDLVNSRCIIHSTSQRQLSSRITECNGTDHYRTTYVKKFRQLPSHTPKAPSKASFTEIWSAEQCARLCILETGFKCTSFAYKDEDHVCSLSQANSQPSTDTGRAVYRATRTRSRRVGVNRGATKKIFYYERIPDGPLSEFINYGLGLLDRPETTRTYPIRHKHVSLQQCAEYCLAATRIECRSFDYDPGKRICLLSHLAAFVFQGIYRPKNVNFIHYEKIDRWLRYYDVTPYAWVLGENKAVHMRVTPNKCARLCLEESEFICRSFEYLVSDSKCTLSDKSASDTSGLRLTESSELHHFQMKPILDCGGILTAGEGNFASPNWPQQYEHHQQCTWQIFGQEHKMIKLKFTHIELHQDSDNCTTNTDSLSMIGSRDDVITSTCLSDQSQFAIESAGDYINVTMVTDSNMAANGFRAFYVVDWPCNNAQYTTNHGQLASPLFPKHYPPNRDCNYRITAPEGYKVALTFTKFHVGRGNLECTEYRDHVGIYDGATPNDHVTELFCGERKRRTILSSDRWIYLTFASYDTGEFGGFHAEYEFVENSLPSPTPTVQSIETTTVNFVDKMKEKFRDKDREWNYNKVYRSVEKPKVASSKERGARRKSKILSDYQILGIAGTVAVLMIIFVFALLLFKSRRKSHTLSHLHRDIPATLNNEQSSGEAIRQEWTVTMSPFGRQHHTYETIEQPSLFSIPMVNNAIYEENLEPKSEPDPVPARGPDRMPQQAQDASPGKDIPFYLPLLFENED